MEIEIKFKEPHISQKKALFSYKNLHGPIINKWMTVTLFFPVIEDTVLEIINRHFKFHTNHETTFSFLYNLHKLQEMSEETVKCYYIY